MTFSAPIWLGVAAALVVFGIAGVRAAEARRGRDLDRFVAEPLRAALTATSSPRRRLVKAGLVVAALALGCVALARPTLGWAWQETHQRGTNVLFAVDVSRSMLADDVKPDRLTRAKLAVIDLLQKLPGDRVGLVAFAGSAFLQSPLTIDHAAFREALAALDADVIPRGGTDVGAALREAEEAFRTAGNDPKLVVLLSDGEDLEGRAKAAADEAAKRGMTVFTVGVGTPAGARISLARAGGRGVVRDERGEPVVSKLDEAGLRSVAEATGGFYVALGARGEGIDELYARALSGAPRRELVARSLRTPIERFQWPIALALALVAGEAVLGERRRRVVPARTRTTGVGVASTPAPRRADVADPVLRSVVIGTAGLLAFVIASGALASPREAEKAYASGAYDEAAQRYRSAAEAAPGDARLRFNEGVAAYRAGRHEEAAQAFEKAIDEGDVSLQQRAYYDLGNARFRTGEAAAKDSPEQARVALESAVKAYDGAIALDATDENARFNRDVASARLEDLKRQEQAQRTQRQQGQQESQQQAGSQQPSEPEGGGQSQSQPQGDAGKQSGEQPQPQKHAGAQPQAAPSDSRQASSQPHGEQPRPGGETQSPGAPKTSAQARTGDEARETAAESGPRSEQADAEDAGEAKREGALERADGKPDGNAPQAVHRDAKPGEMSAEDAERLLDSLRADERQAPRVVSKRGNAGSSDDEPIRNW
ncbi:MAG: VWA domain-containing protein [Deltaproteobacteria bacterium]|nr:VWA domain-containing protein [Deltaproteobacteria bacterium]